MGNMIYWRSLHICLCERLRNASAISRGDYALTFVSCRAYADAYAQEWRIKGVYPHYYDIREFPFI